MILLVIKFAQDFFMKYKNIESCKEFSVRGKAYNLASILTYGPGILFNCKNFIFTPVDKRDPVLSAFQWSDGHIDRLKIYNRKK